MLIDYAFGSLLVSGTPRILSTALLLLLAFARANETHAQDVTASQSQASRPKCEATSKESRRQFDGNTLVRELQGRIAGMNISEGDATSGSSWGVSIRGRNSIRPNQQPLVFVDYVRVTTLAEAGPLLGFVNPSEIVRIEVLRGPAATTMHGMDAAGGVIHIFTKRGSGDESTSSASGSGCPAIP
jgi:outer membrane receptor for ferrienterochelin and colicin